MRVKLGHPRGTAPRYRDMGPSVVMRHGHHTATYPIPRRSAVRVVQVLGASGIDAANLAPTDLADFL